MNRTRIVAFVALITEASEPQNLQQEMSNYQVDQSRLAPSDCSTVAHALLAPPSSFCGSLFDILRFSVGFQRQWAFAALPEEAAEAPLFPPTFSVSLARYDDASSPHNRHDPHTWSVDPLNNSTLRVIRP